MATDPLPPLLSSVKLKYVKLGYQYLVNHILTLLLVPVIAAICVELGGAGRGDSGAVEAVPRAGRGARAVRGVRVHHSGTVYVLSSPRAVYLVDFACFRPTRDCRVPFATFLEHARLLPYFDERTVRFMVRILERSGLGEETCLPPANHYIPPQRSMAAARAEAELVIFSAVDELLAKTRVTAKDIDIVVVNCSLFSPTPSLSAMVVNRYGLRSNVLSFNLSGMGCSAGLISVDLARDLLQARRDAYALVVSTEIITPNYYTGMERAMLLPNCLFRMGAAALLLTNRRAERARAKYRLCHVEEDEEGIVGIRLSKDLMAVAGDALRANITTIGPLVLPASEQLLFLLSLVARKVFGLRWKPYIPDFRQAFDHFCVHAGGRAVIDELQKSLRLRDEDVEASRMALHRFGNTSSSSLWYELAYIESKGRMRRGHRVWMIGFGSGFKCNSAVWRCLRTVRGPVDGPWASTIHRYPVHVPDVVKLS
uniref:3-ketoacyl-CoA synthase n=1 Tax=Ananas comosus var. bracteatus TaxID=296719 RepID=A0A6V7P7B8_ANACO|nr:unnamed protein product [Ananas comosus var. bracteatus]